MIFPGVHDFLLKCITLFLLRLSFLLIGIRIRLFGNTFSPSLIVIVFLSICCSDLIFSFIIFQMYSKSLSLTLISFITLIK